MLSEPPQRNAKPRKRSDFRHSKDGLYAAKHEAGAFKHLWQFLKRDWSRRKSEIESLASRTLSAALQLRFAQNDICESREAFN